MIRLSEKLGVTEEEKSIIISMLFTFIKKLGESRDIEELPVSTIVTSWLRYVKKPQWLNDKIDGDLSFLGEICEMVEIYKSPVNELEIQEYELEFM